MSILSQKDLIDDDGGLDDVIKKLKQVQTELNEIKTQANGINLYDPKTIEKLLKLQKEATERRKEQKDATSTLSAAEKRLMKVMQGSKNTLARMSAELKLLKIQRSKLTEAEIDGTKAGQVLQSRIEKLTVSLSKRQKQERESVKAQIALRNASQKQIKSLEQMQAQVISNESVLSKYNQEQIKSQPALVKMQEQTQALNAKIRETKAVLKGTSKAQREKIKLSNSMKDSENSLKASIEANRRFLAQYNEETIKGSVHLSRMRDETVEMDAKLKQLRASTRSAKNDTAKYGGEVLEAYEKQRRLTMELRDAQAMWKKMPPAIKRNTAAQKEHKSIVDRLEREIRKLSKTTGVANIRTAQSSKVNTSAWRSLRTLAATYASFFTLLSGAQHVQRITQQIDSQDKAYKLVLGSTEDQISAQRFLSKITSDYGADLLTTRQAYLRFTAASKSSNLTLQDQQKIFSSVSKATAALGLDLQKQDRAFNALEQMMSKGKVSSEELRQQLGDSLPGSLEIMASALNTTTNDLDRMLKEGTVLSEVALPKFAKRMEEVYGITNLRRVDTMAAAQGRMRNEFTLLIEDLNASNAFTEFYDTVRDGVKWIRLNREEITSWAKAVAQFALIIGAFKGFKVLKSSALGLFTALKSVGGSVRVVGGFLINLIPAVRGLRVAIGALIVAFGAFKLSASTSGTIGERFKDVQGDITEATNKQRIAMEGAIKVLGNLSESEDIRKEQAEYLKSAYPDILKNIDLETLSKEELLDVQNKLNAAIREEGLSRYASQKVAEVEDSIAKAKLRAAEIQRGGDISVGERGRFYIESDPSSESMELATANSVEDISKSGRKALAMLYDDIKKYEQDLIRLNENLEIAGLKKKAGPTDEELLGVSRDKKDSFISKIWGDVETRQKDIDKAVRQYESFLSEIEGMEKVSKEDKDAMIESLEKRHQKNLADIAEKWNKVNERKPARTKAQIAAEKAEKKRVLALKEGIESRVDEFGVNQKQAKDKFDLTEPNKGATEFFNLIQGQEELAFIMRLNEEIKALNETIGEDNKIELIGTDEVVFDMDMAKARLKIADEDYKYNEKLTAIQKEREEAEHKIEVQQLSGVEATRAKIKALSEQIKSIEALNEANKDRKAIETDELVKSKEKLTATVPDIRLEEALEYLKKRQEIDELIYDSEVRTAKDLQKYKLDQEIKFLQAKLALHGIYGAKISDVDRKQILATIDWLKAEIIKVDNDVDSGSSSDSGPTKIQKMLGIESEEDAREAARAMNITIDNIGLIADAAVDSANERVSAAQESINAAEKEYDRQIELANLGLASDIEGAQAKLQIEQETKDKALKDQEKALKQQRAINEIQEASNMAVAISKAFAIAGPLGVVLGSAMIASFIALKAKSLKRKGTDGVEEIKGTRHESGNDTYLGYSDGEGDVYGEYGEGHAVFTSDIMRKNGPYIKEQVKLLQKGIVLPSVPPSIKPPSVIRATTVTGGDKYSAEILDELKKANRKRPIEFDDKGRKIRDGLTRYSYETD